MVRVGLSRWYVQVSKAAAPRGEVEYCLALAPQAKRYRVLAKQWSGLRCELVEKEAAVRPLCSTFTGLRYDFDTHPAREVMLLRQTAEELASRAVELCLQQGIVDFEGFDKAAAVYIVHAAIMRCAERGQSETPETAEAVDLVPDMRAIRQERERQQRERERLAREAYEAHLEEMARRAEYAAPEEKVSFDLLHSILSPSERQEAAEHRRVTIRNSLGDFIVPVSMHGLVRHYADGKYVTSYCVVFRDYTIPIGDEVLMKVALLKADPHKFLKAANRIPERYFMARDNRARQRRGNV